MEKNKVALVGLGGCSMKELFDKHGSFVLRHFSSEHCSGSGPKGSTMLPGKQ